MKYLLINRPPAYNLANSLIPTNENDLRVGDDTWQARADKFVLDTDASVTAQVDVPLPDVPLPELPLPDEPINEPSAIPLLLELEVDNEIITADAPATLTVLVTGIDQSTAAGLKLTLTLPDAVVSTGSLLDWPLPLLESGQQFTQTIALALSPTQLEGASVEVSANIVLETGNPITDNLTIGVQPAGRVESAADVDIVETE